MKMFEILALIIGGIFILAMINAARRTVQATETSALILATLYLEAQQRKQND
jgi:Na+/pantothenate symporter